MGRSIIVHVLLASFLLVECWVVPQGLAVAPPAAVLERPLSRGGEEPQDRCRAGAIAPTTTFPSRQATDSSFLPLPKLKKRHGIWTKISLAYRREKAISLPADPNVASLPPKKPRGLKKVWDQRHGVYAGLRSAAETTKKVAAIGGVVVLTAAFVAGYVYLGGDLQDLFSEPEEVPDEEPQ